MLFEEKSSGQEQIFGMRLNRLSELINAYYTAANDEKTAHRPRRWFRFRY